MPNPYRTFEYGIVGEPSALDAVLAQLRARQQLWNRLVEIDRAARAAARPLLTEPTFAERIEAVKALSDAISDEIRKRRAQARKRAGVDISDLKSRLQAARAEFKQAVEAAKATKAATRAANAEALAAIEAERRAAVKLAYQQSQCYWGNYNDELAAYNTARVAAMKAGVDLRFRPWAGGEGKVSVLFSSDPCPVQDGTVCSSRVEIMACPPEAFNHPRRVRRRLLSQTVGRIRIGSAPDRSPIWSEFRMVMHRPLPAGQVRQASLVRERVGLKWRYKLLVVVELATVPSPRTEGATVAVDLGWRAMSEGLRVGYAVKEPVGPSVRVERECCLPKDLLWAFQKAQDVQSTLGQIFNTTRDGLLYLFLNPIENPPEWMREELTTMFQWKSRTRMYRFCERWERERLAGNSTAYGDAAAWAIASQYLERYRHLLAWERNLYDQSKRHRREIFRIFAASLLADAKCLVLEDFDIKRMSMRPAPDSDRSVNFSGNARRIAAPSMLRLALLSYAKREGIEVIIAPSEYTTRQCFYCGYNHPWNAAEHAMHRCAGCSRLWDQDANAARNLLKWVEEQRAVAPQPEPALSV